MMQSESLELRDGVFIHPRAIVESVHIGLRSRIWANAHLLPGAVIGSDCNICDGVFIENRVVVGDRVTVKCGVQLWDGVELADDVFVGPNATFTNDKYPRSKHYQQAFLKTVVEVGASIGANATILPGIRIGRGALIGAGAVVTRDVPPNAIITGNPGRISGYTVTKNDCEPKKATEVSTHEKISLLPSGAALYYHSEIEDLRGKLTFGEINRGLPFDAKRYFIVYGVPSEQVRGEHAHKKCHQLLIATSGSITVLLDNGISRDVVTLDSPRIGLHIPPMVWATQYRYSRESCLLVLASETYEADDYIRDYDTFIQMTATNPPERT